MHSNEVFVVQLPDSKDKLEALTAFLKALKIDFTIARKDEYDSGFLQKIEAGELDIQSGNTRRIELDDVWKLS